MRWSIPVCAAVLMACCNTPSPPYRGIAPTRVTVDGSTFDVRVRGNRAEAMRINPQYAPRFGIIEWRAARAMQVASGCKVAGVKGDQALAFGRLDCGNGPPPELRGPVEIECIPVRGSEIEEVGQVRIDLDCSPA